MGPRFRGDDDFPLLRRRQVFHRVHRFARLADLEMQLGRDEVKALPQQRRWIRYSEIVEQLLSTGIEHSSVD